MISITEKLKKITAWSESWTSCVVAFSGGVDSTFLLAALKRYTRLNVIAATIVTPYIPGWEVEEARQFATDEGIEHIIIPMDFPEDIRNNPPERCYLCKRRLFTELLQKASFAGADIVADGTNADDRPEERPGMRALLELEVQSPLRVCGFTKEEIRSLCREWNLPVADKPAYSCLLTRLPHDTAVDTVLFPRIEQAERHLHSLGFPAVRVRTSGDGRIARIEAAPDALRKITHPDVMKSVNGRFKELGYSSVVTSSNKKGGENEKDRENS